MIPSGNIQWRCKSFNQLKNAELYMVLQLRSKVFVVEQNCAYPDLDGKDQASYHLMGFAGNTLVAYARLLPPGLSYTEPSIGRVVISPPFRGHSIGRALMQQSIDEAIRLFGKRPIKISAQHHLQTFYESFGFAACSNVYEEDGIPHIAMMLQ